MRTHDDEDDHNDHDDDGNDDGDSNVPHTCRYANFIASVFVPVALCAPSSMIRSRSLPILCLCT